MKDGLVSEQGSPEELYKKNGTFAHMLKLQTESDGWRIEA